MNLDTSARATQGPELLRDTLLVVARSAVRAAADGGAHPSTISGRILVAWLSLGTLVSAVDPEFEPDERTGVESLAFVIDRPTSAAGGLVLRLSGEYPDSFEPVTLLGPGPHGTADVRRAFFG